jgi:hypothetical protein
MKLKRRNEMVTRAILEADEIDETGKEKDTMKAAALVNPEDNSNLPAHMKSETPEGLESVSRYRSRQTLKIVQPTSQIELVDTFGVGSVITKPGEILVAKKGEKFTATTLGFSPSAQRCADYNDKALEDKFEEVFDPAHPYFARAQDRNRRFEPYGTNGEYKREYVLALNYALLIRGGNREDELVSLTYSRGSAQIGRNLNGQIKRRGRDGISLFGNTFKFHTSIETNGGNSWFTLNHELIPDWAEPEARYAELREMHKEIEAGWQALRESGEEPPETETSPSEEGDPIPF